MKAYREAFTSAWNRAQQGQLSTLFVEGTTGGSFRALADAWVQREQAFIFRWQCQSGSPAQPHLLFGELIRRWRQEFSLDWEQVCQEARIYWPHRPLLQALVEQLPVYRHEPLLQDDLYYEQQEMARGMLAILGALSAQRPIILLLCDLQFASLTLLRFLQGLPRIQLQGRLLLLGHYAPDQLFSLEEEADHWEQFVHFAEKHFTLLQPDEETLSGLQRSDWCAALPAEPATLALRLQQCADALACFAFDEVIRLTTLLFDSVSREEVQLTPSQLRRLHWWQGDARLCLGDADMALESYFDALDLSQQESNMAALAKSYERLAWCYLRKFDVSTADEYARQAVKFATLCQDEIVQILALFVDYYVLDRNTLALERERLEQLMALLRKHEFINRLCFINRNLFVFLRFHENLTIRECQAATREAIDASRRMGNMNAVAAAYQSLGILYSYENQYHRTLRCFRVSEQLRTKLGEPIEIIRIRNGVGYFATLVEEYGAAYQVFLQAFAAIKTTHDFNEISVTLFNFAWLYFVVGQYEDAGRMLDALLQLMRVRKMTALPFRNITDIYAVKGIIEIKIGEPRRALHNLQAIEGRGTRATPMAVFLSTLLDGLVNESMGNLVAAEHALKRAPGVLEKMLDLDKRLYPLAQRELGAFYQRRGQPQLARAAWEAGIAFCEQQQMKASQKQLQALLDGQTDQPAATLPELALDLDTIVELARRDVKLERLQKHMREVRLINRLHILTQGCESAEELVKVCIHLLHASFPVELVAFVSAADEPVLRIGELSQEADFDPRSLLGMTLGQRPHMLRQALPNASDPLTLLLVPVGQGHRRQGILVLSSLEKGETFSSHQLDILQIFGSQLAVMLERMAREAELKYLSVTDPLTQLANRAALIERLHDELQRARRYEANLPFSLAFVDLDNFKHYNDTFGHKVGDMLLKNFARLLRDTVRKTDFVARYGGDEFVVLLPQTGHRGAMRFADHMLKGLRQFAGFEEQIAFVLGRPVSIPLEKKLGCSIGISECRLVGEVQLTADELIRQADEAVYRAKAEGKNRLAVYR